MASALVIIQRCVIALSNSCPRDARKGETGQRHGSERNTIKPSPITNPALHSQSTLADLSKRTFHFAFSLRTCSRRDSSTFSALFRAALIYLCNPGQPHPSAPRPFHLHSRLRDRTRRIASRADTHARATSRPRSSCLSASAAEAASAAAITTSPRALDLAAPTTTTTLVVSSNLYTPSQYDCLPRTRLRCANATAPGFSWDPV